MIGGRQAVVRVGVGWKTTASYTCLMTRRAPRRLVLLGFVVLHATRRLARSTSIGLSRAMLLLLLIFILMPIILIVIIIVVVVIAGNGLGAPSGHAASGSGP